MAGRASRHPHDSDSLDVACQSSTEVTAEVDTEQTHYESSNPTEGSKEEDTCRLGEEQQSWVDRRSGSTEENAEDTGEDVSPSDTEGADRESAGQDANGPADDGNHGAGNDRRHDECKHTDEYPTKRQDITETARLVVLGR